MVPFVAGARGDSFKEGVCRQFDTTYRVTKPMTNSHEQNSIAGDETLAEHVLENRNHWDRVAPQWVDAAERSWAATSPSWGIWGIDESELNLLPASMAGMQAIELGCGTAYISAWMARRGATVTGVDNSQRQLDTARRLMMEYEQPLTLLHGNAEAIPLKDSSFDFAISEYGAAIWCDPYVWIPEASRLLRQNGQLVFIANHPLATICTPVTGEDCDEHLHQSYFELYRQDWRDAEVDPGGIEFNLTTSEWLRLFRKTGFEVVDYHEPQAPADWKDKRQFFVSGGWAGRWPSEQIWQLVRR